MVSYDQPSIFEWHLTNHCHSIQIKQNKPSDAGNKRNTWWQLYSSICKSCWILTMKVKINQDYQILWRSHCSAWFQIYRALSSHLKRQMEKLRHKIRRWSHYLCHTVQNTIVDLRSWNVILTIKHRPHIYADTISI